MSDSLFSNTAIINSKEFNFLFSFYSRFRFQRLMKKLRASKLLKKHRDLGDWLLTIPDEKVMSVTN